MARRSPRTPDPRLIDSRSRIALSREVMRALEVKPGDYVTFELDDHGSVRLHKLTMSVAVPRRPGPG